MTTARRRLPSRRGRAAAALAVAVVAASSAHFAAPLTARAAASTLVEWEAPEACPGAAAVFERLSAALGYEPQTLGKLSRVRGNVLPAPQGFRLSLEVVEGGRRSSRWLEASSCEDLVDAAVLAITLALAPASDAPPGKLASAELAPGAAGSGAAAAAEEPGAASADPPATGTLSGAGAEGGAESAAVPVKGIASAGAVVELGALPAPALGVAVSAGAQWTAWSLEAHGTLFGSQRLAARPGQFVEFELAVGGLRGCRRWLEQPLALDTCGVLEAGRWEAFGGDLENARRARELWLAPGTGLAAGVELTTGLTLQLRAEAVVPLTRKRYIVNENEVVHTPGAVSWRLAAGLLLGTR